MLLLGLWDELGSSLTTATHLDKQQGQVQVKMELQLQVHWA